MKYVFLIVALISTLSADFDWPGDYDKALKTAKVEKKAVYLMIGSSICPWCEKFENNVLEDKEVYKKLTKNFVPLYLSKDIDDIPSQFSTSPIPRHYFLNEKGEIIEALLGYRSKEAFIEIINDVNKERKGN